MLLCCLHRISPGYCPLCYVSNLVLLRRPSSGNLHQLRFESATAQYGRQLALRGRGVSAVITWSLATAVIGLCYKNRKCSRLKDQQKSLCLSLFWDLCAMSTGGVLFWKVTGCCCFGAWLPVCSVLNSAELLRRASASTRYRSPGYLFQSICTCTASALLELCCYLVVIKRRLNLLTSCKFFIFFTQSYML